MECHASATLSLIDDLLENAQSDRPVDPCVWTKTETEEVDVEFVTPMAEAVLV